MKTIISTVESYNNVVNNMKTTKKDRDLFKATFCSLSRTLRNMQTVEGFKACKPIFELLGLPTTRQVGPKVVEARINNWVEDKKLGKLPAYTTRRAVKDDNGAPVLDKEGNQVYEYSLTAVRPGAWTIDKFVKVLSSK